MTGNQHTKPNKIERAWKLHQQGVGNTEIAQRLGSTPKSIGNMIHTIKERSMAEIGKALAINSQHQSTPGETK